MEPAPESHDDDEPPSNVEVPVPDIGDFSDVPVIEVHVAPGDKVNAEDPLLTLESDKATMDVPAPIAGTVTEVLVKVGDEVSEGTPILLSPPATARSPRRRRWWSSRSRRPASRGEGGAEAVGRAAGRAARGGDPDENAAPAGAHAGPSVRRMARELGIDLSAVTASGPKGRITKDDLLSLPQGPARAAPPRRRRRRGCGDPGDPGAGLLEVRAGRAPASCRGSRRCRARSCTARG